MCDPCEKECEIHCAIGHGVSPGMVKHQRTQTVLWAEQQFEEQGGVFNIANLIKTDPTAGEGE
ncbi:hypothetical protein E5N77_36280 [Streptomyces sp. SS52]|nr:hypothetical protein E5N77_36280 [Streptomyces sp. SS52]